MYTFCVVKFNRNLLNLQYKSQKKDNWYCCGLPPQCDTQQKVISFVVTFSDSEVYLESLLVSFSGIKQTKKAALP